MPIDPMTLSDHERREARNPFFSSGRSFRLTSNDQIRRGNKCREGRISKGPGTPPIPRSGIPALKTFWAVLHTPRAVVRIFFYRDEGNFGPKDQERGGGLGKGQPARWSGERCKLPNRVRGGAPTAKRFSRVLSVQK